MKKFTRVFLSREEKLQLTEGNAWDSVISEIQKTLDVPSMLTEKDMSSDPNKIKWIVRRLCERQDWRCFWCGGEITESNHNSPSYRTLEHVVPKTSKGKNVHRLTNLRASCRECNQGRSIWSSNKSLCLKIEEQKKKIKEIENENHEIKKFLKIASWDIRLALWLKKIFRKRSK